MKSRTRIVQSLLLFTLFILSLPAMAFGNPLGPVSTQGVGSIQGLGTSQVTVQQIAPKGIINWQSFNIASGETTRFIQPSAQSIILNRINDANPSQIFGSLLANGSVILLNPNGVMFGKGAQVNVNGLIASSLNLTDSSFLKGNFLFEGSALNGFVKNAGSIQTPAGGFVYLFAPNVENSGIISTPGGHITLAAGTSAYLSDRPDGVGFLVQVTAPAGEAVNLGDLIADGGRINIYGQVINQSGLIQANSVREKNGQIELFASESLNLKNGSRILAKGGNEGVSSGGTVIAKADLGQGSTFFESGGVIDVSGGSQGGNGGSVEISGHQVDTQGMVRGSALSGYTGGKLLLDPYDLTLNESYFGTLAGSGLSNVQITADHDINVVGNIGGSYVDLTSWANLSPASALSFTAGHDIHFSDLFIFDSLVAGGGSKWSFSATAGNDIVFTNTQLIVGNGGGINLNAGRDIRLEQVSGGFYPYLWAKDGGDIHLTAGGNLVAPTVFDSLFSQFSGIRLDGGTTNQVGNLYIKIGGDFLGGMIDGIKASPGFTLSNGTADIAVGGNFGAVDNYAKLTLGKGTIRIAAPQNIYLGNVQDQGLIEHDIAITDPGNQVILTSLTGDIHLKPTIDQYISNVNLGRLTAIYPASFTVSALQGNIYFESPQIKFWPSFTGKLSFTALNNIQGVWSANLPEIIQLYPDPEQIIGQSSFKIGNNGNFDQDPNPTLKPYPVKITGNDTPGTILFKTKSGDITHLAFRFLNPVIEKKVTIDSGHDLNDIIAEIGVPTQTSQAFLTASGNMVLSSQGIKDPKTGLVRPTGGIAFFGPGKGIISVGGTLDLAASRGIEDKISQSVYRIDEFNDPGSIDISVGGDLRMTQTKIWSYNGASIKIHGLNGDQSPVGGKVNVGIIGQSSNDLGIVTLRGGNIDILTTGDINVNASRVATISGDDIRLTSLRGDINAGIGSPSAQVDFQFVKGYDQTTNNFIYQHVLVPGSGIFTFHKDDPNPLPKYPPLQLTPSLEAARNMILKESFLGLDVSTLETKFFNEAGALYAIQKAEFRKDWKLGNIDLTAGQNVVVPPAGVRGKVVTIKAANLVLSGGQISGDLNLNVGSIQGNTTGITGPLTGNVGNSSISTTNSSTSSGLGGLSGATGSVSTVTASSATVTASAVQKSVAEESETEREEDLADAKKGETRTAENSRRKRHGAGMKSLQIRHGVVIEVETSEASEEAK